MVREKKEEIVICPRCGFDSNLPSISFGENGECNFCKSHDLLLEYYPRNAQLLLKKRSDLIRRIKYKGRKKNMIVS